jgi:hypothetical protein
VVDFEDLLDDFAAVHRRRRSHGVGWSQSEDSMAGGSWKVKDRSSKIEV